MTSQKLTFVLSPTPSGVGQVTSGTTFFDATAGGGAGFRTGGFRVCAESGTATSSATTIARIGSVYVAGRAGWTGWAGQAGWAGRAGYEAVPAFPALLP